MPHLQQVLAVSGSSIHVPDLVCLFDGLVVAYWTQLGQCPPSRILSHGSDRRLAASITVMSVWIVLIALVDVLVFMVTALGGGACSLWGKQVP